MTQQVINIGSAPDDATGDQLRISFDKCNGNFTELYQGVAASAPIGNAIEYQFNNNTTEPPASGEIRFNLPPTATTKLWVSQTTVSGTNIKQFLSAATTGAKLVLQDKNDNTNYVKFDVTGAPIDKTTYWEASVAVTASGGNLPNAHILAAVTAAAGVPEAPTDGQQYAREDASWTVVTGGGGGAGGSAQYTFSTNTSAPPSSGQIRLNNAAVASATIVWINNLTSGGTDLKRYFETLSIGTKLYIQDESDSSQYAKYQIASAPVDHTTYWEFPVTYLASGGALVNQQRAVLIVQPPPGGGNVSNSGTPTVGQYAKWLTATTIQGVAPATVLSDIGAAPLASPALSGNPTAPTPTAGDNDTSLATTAFVTAAIAAIPAAGSMLSAPQGRLTLQTATPVMTTSQSAKTTVFYTPYIGNRVPIYDGTTMVMTGFAELSNITTNSSTGNAGPAAVAASSVYDLFVWNNSGTLTLTRGPVWTSTSARSVGTALLLVNGIWLNNASITNGPAAQRGTYVGTIYSHIDANLYWAYPVIGSPGYFLVWNCYNRVAIAGMHQESAASWTSPGADTWRAFNGSPACRMHAVHGLAEDAVSVLANAMAFTPSSFASINIGINNSTTPAALMSGAHAGANTWHPLACNLVHVPAIGFNSWQMLEKSGATDAQYAGTFSAINAASGMVWQGRM